MASDREILTEYMNIIDALQGATAQSKTIDGSLAVGIENLIKEAISAAARVAYRIQRDKWDENGGTYEI